jgi:hypothetical protein
MNIDENREMARASIDLRDQYVEFRVCDIYLPDPVSILTELHGTDRLCGRVIETSDAGPELDAFVVVEVKGIERRVVLPVSRVEVTHEIVGFH